MTRKDRTISKNYIFGDHLGNVLSLVPMEVQMQASLMSMTFMMIGLVIFAVYLIGFGEFGLFFKIMTGLNTFFGLIFMWSYLVTIFQQYRAYMETKEIINAIQGVTSTEQEIISSKVPISKETPITSIFPIEQIPSEQDLKGGKKQNG